MAIDLKRTFDPRVAGLQFGPKGFGCVLHFKKRGGGTGPSFSAGGGGHGPSQHPGPQVVRPFLWGGGGWVNPPSPRNPFPLLKTSIFSNGRCGVTDLSMLTMPMFTCRIY